VKEKELKKENLITKLSLENAQLKEQLQRYKHVLDDLEDQRNQLITEIKGDFNKKTIQIERSKKALINLSEDLRSEKQMLIKAKDELEKKSIQLNNSNKDLQQFAFVASHDLKAPTSNMMALLSLIVSDNVTQEQNEELIQKLKQAAKSMHDTISTLNEVLSVKMNIKLDMEKVNISTALANILLGIENMLEEHNVELIEDFREVEYINFPLIHLNHILQNLVTNAIKFRREGQIPIIKIKTKKVTDGTCLIVEDNGQGIDLEKYGGKLFGLFQRFHLDIEGKGIGLHLCKNIIEYYGGRIDVESKEGVGTTFKIILN